MSPAEEAARKVAHRMIRAGQLRADEIDGAVARMLAPPPAPAELGTGWFNFDAAPAAPPVQAAAPTREPELRAAAAGEADDGGTGWFGRREGSLFGGS